ncbi:helix-turn-helix domain-containing protein [Dyadobacter sp. 3J3]|uniref:helix-turn-helix domain-containing protein n=1 Tax=Dyadobacter sp. 3J3 TaxID=2606600 RepID=UPI00135B17DF|nr:helix-turn-helix domain-containing protein [Dyadobacter sp. 3J3]
MKELFSTTNDVLIGIKQAKDCNFEKPRSFTNYSILFVYEGQGLFHADFGKFPFSSPTLLFSTPLQHISIESSQPVAFSMIQFHSDFYCIEYHKAQVACNGLLFNNIYLEPSVKLSAAEAKIFSGLMLDVEREFSDTEPDDMVLRSYLQLILAKASSIKIKSVSEERRIDKRDEQMEQFLKLLEKNYLNLHKPSDYADLLSMSLNNFSKRCTRYFKKPPSALIQERIVLEAKKKLHLTRQSIKEIANALNFEDEFYFSRFFKKFTKVSPQTFRDKTGISIVADLIR